VFYSGYTEKQVLPGHQLLIEKLLERNFSKLHVTKKYAHKRFLKASVFAIQWARAHYGEDSFESNSLEEMALEE
jgi:G2/mitotic-specific cyclin 2